VWLISLNTLACLYKNTGLFEAMDDPGMQLTWLENQLWEARNNTAQVIIAGNVAPGNPMCNRQWSYRYNVLMEAFQDVVVLQLFGYSQVDGFQLQRNPETGKAFGVSQIAGTFSNFDRNPSARSIQMDLATNLPVQIDVFTIKDVSSALNETMIESGFSYSYPKDFGMEDLSPSSYDKLTQRISLNETAAVDYNQ